MLRQLIGDSGKLVVKAMECCLAGKCGECPMYTDEDEEKGRPVCEQFDEGEVYVLPITLVEDAIEALKEKEPGKGTTIGRHSGIAETIAYGIKDVPSVPAVPLDKLCKWLSRNAWAFDCEGCEGYCKAMVDCKNDVGGNPEYWKDKLTKWMEEQDAAD